MANIIVEMLLPSLAHLEISIPALIKLRDANKHKGPTILLLGHFGNWEVLNKLPKYMETPVKALYKPIKNKWVDHFVRKRRTRYGLKLVKSGQALKTLLKEKDNNSIILFLADQFPGYHKGIEVDFLNQKTLMYNGAEQIARINDAFVGYLELYSKGNHTWRIKIETICENAADSEEGFITTKYAQLLEKSIRQSPALWLWSHRRWK